MHILFLFLIIPVLIALAGVAFVALMALGSLVLQFPLLLLPAAGFGWLLRSVSRLSPRKDVPCQQM